MKFKLLNSRILSLIGDNGSDEKEILLLKQAQ